MGRQGVAPNNVSVFFKVCPQDDFNFRVFDGASLNRINQGAGIIESHLPELSIAASVAVEGYAPKKSATLGIDVEVGEDTVILQAETEATRP